MSTGSFAAAQERILAAQAARRIEDVRRLEVHQTTAAELPIARLPYPLNKSATPLLSFWNKLVSSEGTRPSFRVGQVDAELLDEELLGLLKGQIGEALKYFGPHLLDDWTREITLGLRAVLFKLTIWDNDTSYGASLQNLRYSDARHGNNGIPRPTTVQKSLYGLITVFGRYGWDRWQDWLIEQEGGYADPSPSIQRLSQFTSRLSNIHSIASFASFIIFLANGRYRTLVDRLLRIRLVSPVSHIDRQVSFEYLNRQLVWHAFTEFLLFLLPLVGISRWRRWLSRLWKRTKAAVKAKGDPEAVIPKAGPLASLPERTCAICYQDQNQISTSEAEVLGANTGAGGGVIGSALTDIVNPYQTKPCGCVYCFVCLASKIEAEEGSGWQCLRCGEIVHKCRPWSGDVVESKRKTAGKSVGFTVDGESQKKQVERRERDEHTDETTCELESSRWALEDVHRNDDST